MERLRLVNNQNWRLAIAVLLNQEFLKVGNHVFKRPLWLNKSIFPQDGLEELEGSRVVGMNEQGKGVLCLRGVLFPEAPGEGGLARTNGAKDCSNAHLLGNGVLAFGQDFLMLGR